MTINKEWHEKNKMPKNASFEERIKWHLEHNKNCSCRPGFPKKLEEEMKNKSEAVALITKAYEESFLEPELRPEYKKKLLNIMKGKHLSRKEFEKTVRSEERRVG